MVRVAPVRANLGFDRVHERAVVVCGGPRQLDVLIHADIFAAFVGVPLRHQDALVLFRPFGGAVLAARVHDHRAALDEADGADNFTVVVTSECAHAVATRLNLHPVEKSAILAPVIVRMPVRGALGQA